MKLKKAGKKKYRFVRNNVTLFSVKQPIHPNNNEKIYLNMKIIAAEKLRFTVSFETKINIVPTFF